MDKLVTTLENKVFPTVKEGQRFMDKFLHEVINIVVLYLYIIKK